MAAAGALALCLLGSAPAAAEDAVFTVSHVSVDQTAKSATKARALAIAEGHRKAYKRLIRRLVPLRDQARAPALSANGIADLVRGFEVQSEKTSDVRYLADLQFDFSPDAVRKLLRDADVPFAETRSKRVVVLPVLRRAGTLLLWDSVNDWLKAWKALPPPDGLVPMVVPEGGLADVADISAEQALSGDQPRIDAIARRYGAEDALLVYGVLSPQAASGRATLQVTTSRFGAAASERTVVQSYETAGGEDVPALLARAAAAVRAEVEESWKRDNILRFNERRRLVATVAISSFKQWLALRRRLDEVAFVERAELLELSRDEAQLRLSYLGDEQQLALALAQRDLTLRHGATAWKLSLRSAAPAEAR